MTLQVRQGLHGRGVFTTDAISSGVLILRYGGPFLSYAETSPSTLAVQVGPGVYLGASGGMDDFVNHSCSPNAGLVVRSPDEVVLVAIRRIEAEEEIFFDYSTTMDEDDFEMPCGCGSAECRGIVRDFKHLPEALKRRYALLGIVPAYNLRYVVA